MEGNITGRLNPKWARFELKDKENSQNLVVQKPVNANLGLKLNQVFWFSCFKAFALLIFGYSLKAVKVEF